MTTMKPEQKADLEAALAVDLATITFPGGSAMRRTQELAFVRGWKASQALPSERELKLVEALRDVNEVVSWSTIGDRIEINGICVKTLALYPEVK